MPSPALSATVGAALAAAHRNVIVALWLSTGMVLATAMLGLVAAGWRRPALFAGAAYAATLCALPLGHARALGPVGVALAFAGLLRNPRRS